MNQLTAKGIVLNRTDYGEADRIVTMLTPDHGKLRLMARGVRKPKSKLAGGIELFSVSHITCIQGRGEIGTLISARLIKHFSAVVHDIDRVQTGYELIKTLNKATEDHPEPDYFTLLEQAFEALDDLAISLDLIRLWFQAGLLRLGGHAPNLSTDTGGLKLEAGQSYNFDFDSMAFMIHAEGRFAAGHIKFLRLTFSGNLPKVLAQVQGFENLLPACLPLVQTMLNTYIRV